MLLCAYYFTFEPKGKKEKAFEKNLHRLVIKAIKATGGLLEYKVHLATSS